MFVSKRADSRRETCQFAHDCLRVVQQWENRASLPMTPVTEMPRHSPKNKNREDKLGFGPRMIAIGNPRPKPVIMDTFTLTMLDSCALR